MKCIQCGRELKEDSRFCDNCGNKVLQEEITGKSLLDRKILFGGIAFSIIISVLVTVFASSLHIPLLFGGLFLPFFWLRKKNKDRG